jgi:hypothetical protein
VDALSPRSALASLRVALGSVVAAALALGGCHGCGESSPGATPSAPLPGATATVDRTTVSLVSLLPTCDIDHRGQLVDFGTDMMRARVGKILHPEAVPVDVQHDGATWGVIENKRTNVSFTLAAPTTVFASARIQPRAAKSVSFYVDEQLLGAQRLPKGDPRVVKTEPTSLPIDAGAHTLSVHLSPGSKDEPLADIDWLRLGVPDDDESTYGAPTLASIVSEGAVLQKVPHRAISLRAPATIRCPIRVPRQGTLKMSLGVFGSGDEQVEAAIRADGAQPVTLLTASLEGGDDAAWKDVETSLDPFAEQLVELELRVPKGASSARALFGDPEIVVPTTNAEPVAQAQVVVVVVFSGVDRDELPPYKKTPDPNLERFTRLADQAIVFTSHRAPATNVSSVMASLLTELPPSAHTLTDPGDALPAAVPTMFDVAHDASVTTAFFTAVPQSFKPFGLSKSVEHVVETSPVAGDWKSPIAEAATWIETTLTAHPKGKILVVIHARGGHPPWTVGGKQLDSLPPTDYSGDITPRRAGEQIALYRRKKGREMPQNDFVRVQALHQVGLAEEDHALGELLDTLESSVPEERSLVIVTSDVSSGMSTLFADDPPLAEPTLSVPLYLLLPKHAYAGRVVSAPTEDADIARTALASLGLPALGNGAGGQDLASVAAGAPPIGLEPFVAESGPRLLARWGSLSMTLKADGDPFLCDVDVDPTCAYDRRALRPFATDAIMRGLSRRQVAIEKLPPRTRVTATLDADTAAALRVWGSLQ